MVDREIVARGTLADFVEIAWPQVQPGIEYVHGWHIDEMCAHLEAVSRCEIRNLIINIPPGCMKSLLVSVLWQVWHWIRIDPSCAWITGSFDATLCGQRDGGRILALMGSEWFVTRWGNRLKRPNQSAYNFELLGGGFRFATSPGGKGTGRHANIVVIDDPIKPADTLGQSAITRKGLGRVHDWRTQTLGLRRKDPKTHRTVLVMQRLLSEDPTADVLAEGGAVHLNLPMLFEPDYRCETPIGGDRRTAAGELLYPGRYDAPAAAAAAKILGPTGAAAQLQQRPNQLGGTIFRREFWQFWHPAGAEVEMPCMCNGCVDAGRSVHKSARPCVALPETGIDVQAWDMAFKGTEKSDYVAATWWRGYQGHYYLRRILNERLTFSGTCDALLRWRVTCPAERTLVEDAANGPAVIDALTSTVPGLLAVSPGGGHEARAHAATPLFAAGAVWLPHPDVEPLVWALIKQAETFPRSINDDMVDAMTHPLVWYRNGSAEAHLSALARAGGRA